MRRWTIRNRPREAEEPGQRAEDQVDQGGGDGRSALVLLLQQEQPEGHPHQGKGRAEVQGRTAVLWKQGKAVQHGKHAQDHKGEKKHLNIYEIAFSIAHIF